MVLCHYGIMSYGRLYHTMLKYYEHIVDKYMVSNYYGYGEGKTSIRVMSTGLIPQPMRIKKSSYSYCLVCGKRLNGIKLCSKECKKQYYRNKNKTVYSTHPELFGDNRGFSHIKLMSNPFKNILEINQHHINNIFTVPIPQGIHRKCCCNDRTLHRNKVKRHWIYDFLGINAIITENRAENTSESISFSESIIY